MDNPDPSCGGIGGVFPRRHPEAYFPDILGAGRFAKIGIPGAEIMGPFVGVVELVCGALIILGLFTRWATIPLIVTMIVALVSTKLPILLGEGFGPFSLPTSNATASGAHSMSPAPI
jgi:hypothetical protein